MASLSATRMMTTAVRSGAASAGFHSTAAAAKKVCVVGGGGGIGQPLSLLLKMDPNVSHVSVFDMVGAPGVAADLGHIDTPSKATGHGMSLKQFTGDEAIPKDEQAAFQAKEFDEALQGCDVVVIPAGVPRKPGMTRDDLFNTNAGIVAGLAEACAKNCPDACYLIISNPVNSTVPIFAEVLKKHGAYNPAKLMGVTTLDVVRANTFVAEKLGQDVLATKVTVIGGHAGTTILPLLSQVPGGAFSDDDVAALTHRIQFGGDEVVQAKDGAGSATLSMAWAGAKFTDRLLKAFSGEKGVVECTFVENGLTDAPFFSTPCTLGPKGVEDIHAYGALSAFEQDNFDKMMPDLVAQAAKGVAFVNK